MCGVFGAFNVPAAAEVIAYGLHGLQHRGGDGAGILTHDEKRRYLYTDYGSVSSIFLEKNSPLPLLKGRHGIGHTRYATVADSTGKENLQPLAFGIDDNSFAAIAHNGNFPNYLDLRRQHLRGTPRVTEADTEVFFRLVLRETREKFSLSAVADVLSLMQGSCSAVMVRPDRLIAIRDPSGNRPLYWGKKGDGFVVSSEPTSLDAVDVFEYHEVPPGCIMAFTKEGIKHFQMPPFTSLKQCVFELVYFAFPASEVFGVDVADFRIDLGIMLAKTFNTEIDLVVGVPNSAVEIAKGFALQRHCDVGYMDFDPHQLLQVWKQESMYRRHDVRSFIEPSEEAMLSALSRKFALWAKKINGKRTLLIDDSIVRGHTSRWLVQAFRKRGAPEVHITSGCPPIIARCLYGIFMENKQLLAVGRDNQAIAREIEADSALYPSMPDFQDVFRKHGFLPQNGCFACMDSNYWHEPALT